MKWNFQTVLIHVSLMAMDVEHIFKYLLAILIYFFFVELSSGREQ